MYSFGSIDPPWTFKTYSKKGEGRTPQSIYPTLDIEELKSLNMGVFFNPDALIGLWVTGFILDQAIEVGKSWGFQYKTILFTWAKLNGKTNQSRFFFDFEDDDQWWMGQGYHTRKNTEMCLLFSRGKGLSRMSNKVRELIVKPRGGHSRKPLEFYQRIECLYPGPYVEIFARPPDPSLGETDRPGWDLIGNEIDGKDIRDVIKETQTKTTEF